MLLLQMQPEEVKTLGIVLVLFSAIVGAILYPIARAFARRLEGNGNAEVMQRELAEVHARLDALQQGEARMAELEARLDFAERMLTRQRDADSLRLPGA
jgi:hypothetical protein